MIAEKTITINEQRQNLNAPVSVSQELVERLLKENEYLRRESENLRRTFEVAVAEFAKKEARINVLEKQLSCAWERIRFLEKENEKLKTQFQEEQAKANLFASMLFGKKSEKSKGRAKGKSKEDEKGAGANTDENKKGSGKEGGAREGHAGHGRSIPDLEIIDEVIIDLPEDKRRCPKCGGIAHECEGLEDISYEITVEIKYGLRKIVRKRYKRGCDCEDSPQLFCAPVADKLIPKGKFSIEFWANVMINKYMNHLPVERQLFEMRQHGLPISSGTIFGGLKKIYSLYLEALYQAMERQLRKGCHWHADETKWYIFVDPENSRWYLWGFSSKDIVLFVLDKSRAASVPLKVLFGLDMKDLEKRGLKGPDGLIEIDPKKLKKLNVDRYSSYKTLARYGLVLLAFCWSHVRRDFTDLQKKYFSDTTLWQWAQRWVDRIGKLYQINDERVKHENGSKEFEVYDRRLRKRLSLMEQRFKLNYDDERKGKVMDSMKEHWPGLTLFLEHPEIPMDNNSMEREIRCGALARKNWWGNHSVWGGNFAACMYSIIRTCLKNNINPRAYLEYYFRECAKQRAAPEENEIDSFLPHNLPENIKDELKIKTPQDIDSS